MNRPLTTQNAAIVTAKVELKTLSVSGKQVSMAVFRQIPENDDLFNKDGSLAGVPWGRVNYFWDGEEGQPKRHHVLWQRGPDLFRSILVAKHFDVIDEKQPDTIVVTAQSGRCAASHAVASMFERHGYGLAKGWGTYQHRTPEDIADFTTAVVEFVRDINALNARTRSLFKSVTDLPQLFIAV